MAEQGLQTLRLAEANWHREKAIWQQEKAKFLEKDSRQQNEAAQWRGEQHKLVSTIKELQRERDDLRAKVGSRQTSNVNSPPAVKDEQPVTSPVVVKPEVSVVKTSQPKILPMPSIHVKRKQELSKLREAYKQAKENARGVFKPSPDE